MNPQELELELAELKSKLDKILGEVTTAQRTRLTFDLTWSIVPVFQIHT